uniref:Alcohol dehydrogenase iron-type/glycerol dehydrogenase GldA domain-containing protein n=1 Tax=Bionectria ochroleuca TaxID=29856 RepID=A0A0B7JYN3_BIOOC
MISPPVSISGAPATGSPSVSICSASSTSASKDRPPSPSLPSFSPRIVYGPDAIARLPSELGRLHLATPLIVSSPSCISLARRIQTLIPNLDSRILDSALVNVPQKIIDDALARITDRDCVISIGGISAMALARTIGGSKEIPHICIPTTYSGSEMGGNCSNDAARRRSKVNSRRGKMSDSSPRRNSSGSASQSDSGSSRKTADIYSKNMPSIIIYDEGLTAMNTSSRFSAPTCRSEFTARTRRPSNDDAQWSYIHLPGV